MVLGVDAGRAAGPRTGVGRDLEHLLAAWSREELPFELVRVFSPAPIEGVPVGGRLRLEVLPGRPGIRWQSGPLRRAAAGVDVLFALYTLPPGFRGRSVVGNLGILEGRHAPGSPRARARSWHIAWSARRADVVIANSEVTKAGVVRHFGVPPDRVVVVRPGVAACFRPIRGGEEEAVAQAAEGVFGARRPFFLFVGKLSERRHVPELLEGFVRFRKERPEFGLVLVGPNVAGLPLDDLVARRGLARAVRHVPFLDQNALALLYRGAQAFVLPTEYEGFSFTIPEALASACPVVTLRHDSLLEVGLDGAALVLPDALPGTIAHALERLAGDDGLRADLARRGPPAVRGLSWEENARATMGVLARVAAGAR